MTQNNPWAPPPRISRGHAGEPATEAIPAAQATERMPVAPPPQMPSPEPPPFVLRRARPAVFIAPAE